MKFHYNNNQFAISAKNVMKSNDWILVTIIMSRQKRAQTVPNRKKYKWFRPDKTASFHCLEWRERKSSRSKWSSNEKKNVKTKAVKNFMRHTTDKLYRVCATHQNGYQAELMIPNFTYCCIRLTGTRNRAKSTTEIHQQEKWSPRDTRRDE